MGEVYRARDPRLNREVAITVLPASFSDDADRLRRFEQEAQAAGALNHPNIMVVYDIGSHEGAPYVVGELLEGETLRMVLAGGELPPRLAADYALQLAQGLAAAHDKGIVHRDLKPENLFITSESGLTRPRLPARTPLLWAGAALIALVAVFAVLLLRTRGNQGFRPGAAAPDRKSISVLPFQNLSPD